MLYQVYDQDDKPLDAHFELQGHDVVFHARGGTRNGPQARNTDYGPALRLLLTRIASEGLRIEDAWVDSTTVQQLPISERRILDPSWEQSDTQKLFRDMSESMRTVGQAKSSSKRGGNTTKRIRLVIAGADQGRLADALGGRPIKADTRSQERLPAETLDKVHADHVYTALLKLQDGFTDHPFGESTDYDLILDDGTAFPPKAVFGLAATEALGFQVLPKHFAGGEDSKCFQVLRRSGYRILPKTPQKNTTTPNTSRRYSEPMLTNEEREWVEGNPKARSHLKRERASGLAQAKRDAFRAAHGKLYCERCGLDPVGTYGDTNGEACIEVHHTIPIAEMPEGHKTTLDQLQCLCANCHRYVHRLAREEGGTPS